MRLNTANRAFTAIIGVSIAVFGVFAVMVCWVFGVLAYRLATDGLAMFGALSTAPALVLLGLLLASNIFAVRSWRAQSRNTRRLISWIHDHEVPVPETVKPVASRAGLERRLVAIDDPGAFSF